MKIVPFDSMSLNIYCYQVTEISIKESTIKELRKSVDTAGYELVSLQIEMNCLCGDCVDERNRQKSL